MTRFAFFPGGGSTERYGSMIELEQTSEGVLLPVQAQPGARKNGITGVHAGRLKVAVTQVPEKGKANKALIKVLADALNLKRSQVSLMTGETSSRKTILVTGLALTELSRRLGHRLQNKTEEP